MNSPLSSNFEILIKLSERRLIIIIIIIISGLWCWCWCFKHHQHQYHKNNHHAQCKHHAQCNSHRWCIIIVKVIVSNQPPGLRSQYNFLIEGYCWFPGGLPFLICLFVSFLFWWWLLQGFINRGSRMASPSEFTKIVPQQTFFFLQKFKSMTHDGTAKQELS